MQRRLIQGAAVALIAGLAGVGVAVYLKSDHTLGIAILTATVGFFFGLVFKFRLA